MLTLFERSNLDYLSKWGPILGRLNLQKMPTSVVPNACNLTLPPFELFFFPAFGYPKRWWMPKNQVCNFTQSCFSIIFARNRLGHPSRFRRQVMCPVHPARPMLHGCPVWTRRRCWARWGDGFSLVDWILMNLRTKEPWETASKVEAPTPWNSFVILWCYAIVCVTYGFVQTWGFTIPKTNSWWSFSISK